MGEPRSAAVLGVLPPVVEMQGFCLCVQARLRALTAFLEVRRLTLLRPGHCHLRSASARNVCTVRAARFAVLILVLVYCIHFLNALWR